MSLRSLRLIDMNDRELLALINQEGDKDGWVFADHLVDVLGMPKPEPNGKGPTYKPRTAVSSRLSWMTRYGALERNDEKKNDEGLRWRLTQKGRHIVAGKLTMTQMKSLERLRPEQLLHVTDYVSTVYQAVEETDAHLVRRQMQYAVLRRRVR